MNKAYVYMKYKLVMEPLPTFGRAGYFTMDQISSRFLKGKFPRVDVQNAVSELLSEGLLRQYYKTTCDKCDTENWFHEVHPKSGESFKNLTEYQTGNDCSFCGTKQDLRDDDGTVEIVYTIGNQDILDSGLYFGEDLEEAEWEEMRDEIRMGPFTNMMRWIKNGFKRLFAK